MRPARQQNCDYYQTLRRRPRARPWTSARLRWHLGLRRHERRRHRDAPQGTTASTWSSLQRWYHFCRTDSAEDRRPTVTSGEMEAAVAYGRGPW